MKFTLNITPESKRLLPCGMGINPFVSRAFYIMEKWKDIPGFEDLYKVSNVGNIKSLPRVVKSPRKTYRILPERGLTIKLNRYGYQVIQLWRNGSFIHALVHRLVAFAFIPNPENKPQTNHKNGIKSDNRVSNLEWFTNSENQIHSYSCLKRKSISKPVFQYKKNGDFIAEYLGTKDAERITGIHSSSISRNCNNIYNHAGGYIWKYKQ